MQDPGAAGKPAPGVVFDCDMGNHIDDVLALAMLYGFDQKNEARITSVSVSKGNLKAAALCDAIMRYYASGGTGQAPSFSRTLPIGFAEYGKTPEETELITKVLAKQNPDGKPAFPHGVQSFNDTAECPALIRNALTAQQDQGAIVIVTGPATNLARVLAVAGAKDVIQRKARLLVLSAGRFPTGDAEFNIATDVPSAQKVLTEWPGPIVLCGKDIGEAVPYPGSSIESDYSYAPMHPVVEAYRSYKQMPYDAPGADLASVLYAVRPHENYFKLSEPGVVRMREDGGTEFTPAANGKHRHLIFDPAQQDRIVKAFTELASLKPVPRRPRFTPAQQDLPKPPEQVKPPNAKPMPPSR